MKNKMSQTPCSEQNGAGPERDGSTGGSPRIGGCPMCGCTDYHCIDWTTLNQCMDCEYVWVPAAHEARNERSGAVNAEVSGGVSRSDH